MPHGENQNEEDVIADFVNHAIVPDANSEGFEPRELQDPGGARFACEREYPRLEAPLNRGGELSELSRRVGRELDPISVQSPSSLNKAAAETDPRPARAFRTSSVSAGVGLTDRILLVSNAFRSSRGTSAATAFRPDRRITRSPLATRDRIDSSR